MKTEGWPGTLRRGGTARRGAAGRAPVAADPAPPSLDQAALEEEREFLVRSLRDLEAEWAAGDIDEVDYAGLKDDYTARAAAVQRRLADNPVAEASTATVSDAPTTTTASEDSTAGTEDSTTASDGPTASSDGPTASSGSPSPTRRRRWSRWQKVAALVLVIALGGISGWAVHQATSTRQSGETITGSVSDPATLETQLANAQTDITNQKYLDALKIYQTILAANPEQPEALTYQGWLLALAGFVQPGLTSIAKAEQVAPSYADAHLYRGVILLRYKHQPAAAIKELQAYLATKPPASAAAVAREAIVQAQKSEKPKKS